MEPTPHATFTAYRIPTDPELGELLHWEPTTVSSGEQIRAAIGCRVFDCVSLRDDLDMWVDDEGFEVEDPNLVASMIAREHGFGQTYYGTAVFTGGADEDGATLPLSPQALASLQAAEYLAGLG